MFIDTKWIPGGPPQEGNVTEIKWIEAALRQEGNVYRNQVESVGPPSGGRCVIDSFKTQ